MRDMSKFALFAASLVALFVASGAWAAEVIDVSEGYNGIKWGESFDSALTKLKEKFGSQDIQSGPMEIEGFEGKSIGIRKGNVSTGYSFVEGRFFSVGRTVEMPFGSRYSMKEFNTDEFKKKVEESFKKGGIASVVVHVFPQSVSGNLDSVRVVFIIKNTRIYDEEISKLKAARPSVENTLLEQLLAP